MDALLGLAHQKATSKILIIVTSRGIKSTMLSMFYSSGSFMFLCSIYSFYSFIPFLISIFCISRNSKFGKGKFSTHNKNLEKGECCLGFLLIFPSYLSL